MKSKIVEIEEAGPIEVQWIVDLEGQDPELRLPELGLLMHRYHDPTGHICQSSVYIDGWMAEVPQEGEIFRLSIPPRPRPEDAALFARCEAAIWPQLPYEQPVYWNNRMVLLDGWQVRTLQEVETVDELLGLVGYLYLGFSRQGGAYSDDEDYPALIETLERDEVRRAQARAVVRLQLGGAEVHPRDTRSESLTPSRSEITEMNLLTRAAMNRRSPHGFGFTAEDTGSTERWRGAFGGYGWVGGRRFSLPFPFE